ncbi:MAG: phospholipase D-like domain-containing protein [Terrimicrobiaceae bacterium]|nr:phospholipase D-like domain-containing protein [Terrimicrobiaceae bacterium]
MFLPVSHVIVQPDDGTGPVLELIRLAKRSLLLKQFTFSEPEIMNAVVERHKAGVAVRIMLNPKRSGGDRANDETFEFFQKNGVAIQWSNPKFYVTHEKSIVVDGQAALIATFNLCTKYFTQTRDYGVIVQDPVKVGQVVEGFEADWEHREWHPSPHAGLLWSNNNSRALMSKFIDAAKETLDVQHPKFVDATILDRILSAAERGVDVRVLCGGKHGISDWDILDTFSSLRVMHRGGIKVHKQKNLRLHAKLLVSDNAHALVGSMNIDRSAFDLRRELGTTITDPGVVTRLADVFNEDWRASHRYEAPDPLDPSLHHEEDFPHDPDLAHE